MPDDQEQRGQDETLAAPAAPEMKVCKHCGATLVKMVSWVHLSGVAGNAQAANPFWVAPMCIHEPAAEGEKPSGIPRTTFYFGR